MPRPSEPEPAPPASHPPRGGTPAAYGFPTGEAAFDVVARETEVRIYATVLGESERVLVRHDLDTEGRPARSLGLELAREPIGDESSAVLEESAIAVVAVGDDDLVALCDRTDTGTTHYRALWIDSEGGMEQVELGTFAEEDVAQSACFVAVAPMRSDAAIVVHGSESLGCPPVTYDDEAGQCPGYGGVSLTRGRAPEALLRVGTADARPVLVGNGAGWAWGLGPYPFGASIVVDLAGLHEVPLLLESLSLDAFLTTADTLVTLGTGERGGLVSTALRAGAPVTGGDDLREELPSLDAQLSFGCVDGAVAATVRAGSLTVTARAGDAGTSVPWGLWSPDELAGPSPAPQARHSAVAGRLYRTSVDGELELVTCVDGEVTRRETTWRISP